MRRTLLTLVVLGLVVGLGLVTMSAIPVAQEPTPTVEAAPSADHPPSFVELLGSALTTEVPNKRLTLL